MGSFTYPQIQVTAKALTSPGAVSIASNAFSPTPLTVTTGSTVTWTNNESAGSQTTTYLDEDFSSDNWSHDGNQVSSGGLDFTFNRSGTTHKSTYDLGQVVGDFTMRFDFTPSSFTQGGDNFGWVGISNNSNEGRGTQDFHGMMFRGDGSTARYCSNEGSSSTLGNVFDFFTG